MKQCLYCGAEIEHMYVADGRYVALDPEPVFIIEGDGYESFYTDEGNQIIGRRARPDEAQTKEARIKNLVGYAPHYENCPYLGLVEE